MIQVIYFYNKIIIRQKVIINTQLLNRVPPYSRVLKELEDQRKKYIALFFGWNVIVAKILPIMDWVSFFF